MKVLHFLHYAQGGIVSVVFDQIGHGAGRGVTYEAVFMQRTPALEQLAAERGITVHFLSGGLRAKFKAYLGLLSASRPDIVHAHSYMPRLFTAFAQRLGAWPGGAVCTVHNDYPYLHARDLRSRFKRWSETLAIRLLNGPVVACSERTAKVVRECLRVPASRLRKIHNGTSFTPVAAGERDMPIAVTVGRLSEQKNYLGLLDAWAGVARRLPAARLWIIGDGDQRALLEARIDALGLGGSVEMLGWLGREQVAERLRQARLFVLSSLYESLPTAAIEAQTAGLPVLSTAVAGIDEILLPEHTGRIVENASALADSLVELLADPERCRAWGEQGRERARRLFSVERFVTDLEQVYQACGNRPAVGQAIGA